MKDVQAIQGTKLHLGRCGENRALCVWFDVSEWQRLYGEGTVHLLHQRNGDLTPYPCQITVDGSMVGWVVTSADVAVAGRGRAELQYHVGDSCVKSDIYATNTTRSMSEAGPVPPEPEEGWVQQVLEAAGETMSAAAVAAECESRAKASAQSAQKYAGISQTVAQEMEESVQEMADAAQGSAQAAQGSADSAQESAQAAQEARQAAEKIAEDVTDIVGGDFATKDDLKGKADLVNGKVPKEQIPSLTAADVGAVKCAYYGGDMNALVTDGHYRLNTNANLPGYAYYGQCIVSRGNDFDTVAQIVFGIKGQGQSHYAIFRSGGRNSSGVWTWEEWARFATTDTALMRDGSNAMTGALQIDSIPSTGRYMLVRVGADSMVGIQNISREDGIGQHGLWVAPSSTSHARALALESMSDEGVFTSDYILHTGNKDLIYTYGTTDIEAGSASPYETGHLHFVIE